MLLRRARGARGGWRQAAPAVGAATAALAITLTAVPARAIETGAPPQLPPPPPPPITQSPAAPAGGGSKPASAAPRSTAASSSSASASTSSSVSETSGGSSGGALDTRIALAGMLGVSTDCLGFGLGARGGKTWDNHLYIGGSFVYHFPGCGYENFGPVGGNYSSSASAFYFGPEGGYDFDLKAVVLRAYMGLGIAFLNASASGPGIPNGSISSSSNQFVVWPGASVI